MNIDKADSHRGGHCGAADMPQYSRRPAATAHPTGDDRRRLLLGAAAVLAGCGGGDGNDAGVDRPPRLTVTVEGLQGRVVRRLRPGSLGLLAATDAGVYWREAGVWQPLGLAGRTVLDLVQRADNSLLASTQEDGLQVAASLGAPWAALPNDFGGPAGREPAFALLLDGPRLLATHAYGVAESFDGGRRWRPLARGWQMVGTEWDALTVAPTGEIWFGGQNAIEELVLARRDAVTGAITEWSRLMRSPSAVKSVRLVPETPARALVAGEGGIVQTMDGGRSWQAVLLNDMSRFHFDVQRDPQRPQRWVTATWSKTDAPQPLRVAVSDDNGATWRALPGHGDAFFFGGARSQHVAVEQGRTVWRFGLDGGGVARVEIGL